MTRSSYDCHNKNIKLITHPEKNYYAILREKLGWG